MHLPSKLCSMLILVLLIDGFTQRVTAFPTVGTLPTFDPTATTPSPEAGGVEAANSDPTAFQPVAICIYWIGTAWVGVGNLFVESQFRKLPTKTSDLLTILVPPWLVGSLPGFVWAYPRLVHLLADANGFTHEGAAALAAAIAVTSAIVGIPAARFVQHSAAIVGIPAARFVQHSAEQGWRSVSASRKSWTPGLKSWTPGIRKCGSEESGRPEEDC